MGQMLIPAAIGAGIGAVGGAAMGKNPLKTALLGAGIGAGGAGLFGPAAATGAGTTGVTGIVGSNGAIGSSLLSTAPSLSGAASVTGSNAIANAAANANIAPNFAVPSFMDQVGSSISNVPNVVGDWAKANPMQALSGSMQVADAITPQQQAQQMLQQPPPIKASSYNVAPTLGMGGPNQKVASQMQLTPQMLKLYPSYFTGGN